MNWIFSICIFLLIRLHDCSNYRLPKQLSPEKYDIKLITHLDEPTSKAFHFTGEVKIWIDCHNDTKAIILHSKDLKIYPDRTKVSEVDKDEKYQITNQTAASDDFYIIHLQNPLTAGHKYILDMTFEGVLNDGLSGYYRSSYEDLKTGKKKWLATTQMEATDARRAFPCFDEPEMKASFKITLGHHKNYTALSNMPIKKTTPMTDEKDWIWDEFEESVKMSTYLVAFILSDFQSKTQTYLRNSGLSKNDSNIHFEVWARKDAINQVDWANEFGPKATQFLEEYFKIPYPLPKMDMIAIPDFSAGAMENWGLITYRESTLLFDPEISTLSSKARIAEVIAHELAHQWFGNLVTMKWWTDLWLNEGFATYVASVVVDRLQPKWKFLLEESESNLMSVYSLDSLKSSHQISIPIGNPSEISQIFDAISYSKGSCLLRMMASFLTEKTFRQGVTNYLEAHKYSNAEQDNLWSALTDQAHKDETLPAELTVKQIMDTWTLQVGYPVVTVEKDCKTGKAKITQERFLKDISAKDKYKNSCWWIPLSYTTGSELDFKKTSPKMWLSCPKKEASIDVNCDDLLIVNIGATGLYKVNYDEGSWKLIIKKLMDESFKDIPTINRVILIENIMTLTRTGDVSYDIAFDLLEYMKHENEYLPWKTALQHLGYIKTVLARSPHYGNFKKYMRNLLTPIYKSVGGFDKNNSNNEEELDAANFNSLITSTGCRYDVGNCRDEANKLFKKYKEDPTGNPVPKNLRRVIFQTAAEDGGEHAWNFLWRQYKKSNVVTEKADILMALGRSKEVWLLNRYLQWSLDVESGIRKQDSSTVFNSVAGSDTGFYVAESFFKTDLHAIHRNLGPNEHNIARYIKGISTKMISEYEQKELLKLVADNNKMFAKAKLGVEQAIEGIDVNIDWDKKYKNIVEDILSKRVHITS